MSLARRSRRSGLDRARSALFDDRLIVALPQADRRFLRSAFDAMLTELEEHALAERALHGEPHDGNYLHTTFGLRWIDFESTCNEPLEWDLAFLSDDVCAAFRDRPPTVYPLVSRATRLPAVDRARPPGKNGAWSPTRRETALRRPCERRTGTVRSTRPRRFWLPAMPRPTWSSVRGRSRSGRARLRHASHPDGGRCWRYVYRSRGAGRRRGGDRQGPVHPA